MSTITITYRAKCKECKHFTSKKTGEKRKQSFCSLHNEFITVKSLSCRDFIPYWCDSVVDPNPPTLRTIMKTKIDRSSVYSKYNGHCGYCGKAIEFKDMQVDHISPQWSAKDESVHHVDNLMPSCRRCNHYKRGFDLEGFRKLMGTLHERVCSHYIGKVALDYGVVTLHPFDGLFYFEKYKQ